MILHGSFASSASYRVRIALGLKKIDYDQVSWDLRQEAQHSPEYLSINPQGLIPTLDTPDGLFGQSIAILEHLEEIAPFPPLLPEVPADRARVRSLALTIACDLHPLNNLRVLEYLSGTLQADLNARQAWCRHWTQAGLSVLEARLAQDEETGTFCHGQAPSLADVCLIPQVANARHIDCDLSQFPTVARIDATCRSMPAFAAAAPENQPDAR